MLLLFYFFVSNKKWSNYFDWQNIYYGNCLNKKLEPNKNYSDNQIVPKIYYLIIKQYNCVWDQPPKQPVNCTKA